jgi:hypothetical protein
LCKSFGISNYAYEIDAFSFSTKNIVGIKIYSRILTSQKCIIPAMCGIGIKP